MSPLDLRKALAGGKLITRNGDQVFGFSLDGTAKFPLTGYTLDEDGEKTTLNWDTKGRYLIPGIESDNDLFMADVLKEPDLANTERNKMI